jgi:ribonuclease HI
LDNGLQARPNPEHYVSSHADGVFLFGFSYYLGACTTTMAELWAIFKGLQLAKDRGFMHIEI